MPSETGAPDNSSASAPPPPGGQEIVEEKAEQMEVANPEKTDSTPKEKVQEAKMPKAKELSKSQDQPEDKQIHESVPEATTSEMEEQMEKPSTVQPEEQVKVEVVEEKPEEAAERTDELEASVEVDVTQKEALETSPKKEKGEPEVVQEKEASKEVSIEERKPKEEFTDARGAIKASDSLKAMAEPEKASEASHVKEAAEQKPEYPSQEEDPTKECKAPVLAIAPQPLAEDEKTGTKETVEGNPVKEVQDEVLVKIEAPQEESLGVQAKQEAVEKEGVPQAEVEPKQQSETANIFEKTIEIKPSESLQALIRKEKENQYQVIEEKTSESSSDKVATLEKEVKVEENYVRQLSVPEASDYDELEDREKDSCGFKEVEGVTEKSTPEFKKDEDNFEKNDQSTEEEKLKKGVTSGPIRQTQEPESENIPAPADEDTVKSVDIECVTRDVALPSENNSETKQETEATDPIENEKNGRDEGKTGESAPSEATKDPQTKEEKIQSEPIEERKVEETMKPEEKSIKDADKTKDTEDQRKEEAPAKPVSKQSRNIISKVKRSLLKAKKVFIGKSPSSKSISTDMKDDIKVK